jgi:hypothetical protein
MGTSLEDRRIVSKRTGVFLSMRTLLLGFGCSSVPRIRKYIPLLRYSRDSNRRHREALAGRFEIKGWQFPGVSVSTREMGNTRWFMGCPDDTEVSSFWMFAE